MGCWKRHSFSRQRYNFHHPLLNQLWVAKKCWFDTLKVGGTNNDPSKYIEITNAVSIMSGKIVSIFDMILLSPAWSIFWSSFICEYGIFYITL